MYPSNDPMSPFCDARLGRTGEARQAVHDGPRLLPEAFDLARLSAACVPGTDQDVLPPALVEPLASGLRWTRALLEEAAE